MVYKLFRQSLSQLTLQNKDFMTTIYVDYKTTNIEENGFTLVSLYFSFYDILCDDKYCLV